MLKKLFYCAASLLVLTACSDNNNDEENSAASIVGSWALDTENNVTSPGDTPWAETLAFFDDGTAAIKTISTSPDGERQYAYVYCNYTLDNGRFRITDHQTGSLIKSGAYAISDYELTLNNFNYLRQGEPITENWSEKIQASWASTVAEDDYYINTFLTFNQSGQGTERITKINNAAEASYESKEFLYQVKRNYLIREYDDFYQISVISFGTFFKSLTIDGQKYTIPYPTRL